MRRLERRIAEVLRKCARQIASGEAEKISIGAADLEGLLDPAG